MEEATKNQRKEFKLGDRVRSPKFGVGIVEDVNASEPTYPILVKWAEDSNNEEVYTHYTAEGQYYSDFGDACRDIELLEEEPEEEKEMANEESRFKVGDKVWSPNFGAGIVINVYDDDTNPYPVEVKWVSGANNIALRESAYFTKDGEFDYTSENPDMDIRPLEGIDLSDLSEDTGVVDRMMDALDKKTDDAINPSHYKVAGLPEAIDIINHLMCREQYKGFLWGNIIKYAYRFGRKGNKAETAGKIAWYAKKLKELEECET